MIEEVTGHRANVYRFPGVSFTVGSDFIAEVRSHGLTYVDWNASTRDTELSNPTPADLLNAAITTPAYPKRIVMLSHDTTDKTVVADALRDVIRYYKDKGYTFKRF